MATTIRPDDPEAVGARLRLIRIAYGILQGRAETGNNRIGVDSAMKIARKTGVGLDYIYLREARLLPHALTVEIDKLEATKTVKRA